MKKTLLISLLLTASLLQSCDERITPNDANAGTGTTTGGTGTTKTKTDLLTAFIWQTDEVSYKGGGKTILVYSKPKNIASREFAGSKITFKKDGTSQSTKEGFTENGKWKFLSNETQIEITPEQTNPQIIPDPELYAIALLSETNLTLVYTFKKVDFGGDDDWKDFIVAIGLPTTIDSVDVEIKSIPVK